jgi:multiple sugar transport system ATP-binding protein
MRVEIARLHRQLGATMVYVTHDQIEAMTLGQRIVVLKDGEIQQIDTPMALYERPANVFVAGFLGSPRMNLLRGTLHAGDGGPRLRLDDGTELPLPAGEAALREVAGRPLVVGLRPEDMRLASRDDAAGLAAQVEAVEPVGNEAFVNLRCGGGEIVVRMPPHDLPTPGETVRLGCVPGRMHFFDADTGVRLS